MHAHTLIYWHFPLTVCVLLQVVQSGGKNIELAVIRRNQPLKVICYRLCFDFCRLFFLFFLQAFYLKATNCFSWLFADFGIQGNWNPSDWDWEGKGGRGREKEAEKVQLKQLTKIFSLLHLDDSSIFANITLFKRIYPFMPL